MPPEGDHDRLLFNGQDGGLGAAWVLSEDHRSDFRDFHFAMVFGLTPWRLASALRLS